MAIWNKYRSASAPTLVGIAVVLFVIASAVHIMCGDFPKGIDVLPDERRYLDIARSLFSGNGLVIRGESSDFQKILYPLSLFPALLDADSAAQIRMVGVLNSIYACSTVFPALAIAMRLFRNPVAIVGCMALALVTPDLMYSMTFMTESVFMPLSLWLVYLCWRCFESRGRSELVMCVAAGMLCYVTYLCKEVAWMYLIAFAAWQIAAAVRKRRRARRALACMALFAAGFFIPFVVMKLTLFAGLFNSYSQFSFDILQSPYTVLFGLYSIATDCMYFIVGFGVIPVLFLLGTYGELKREERDLALFCLVSLLAGLACVVFTISMREDVGHVALRQHLRYVAPLALPLLFLFMKQSWRFKPGAVTRNPRKLAVYVGLTACFCALVAGFFGTANLSQGFDNSQFHFMRWLLDRGEPLPQEYFDSWNGAMTAIDPDDGDLLVIEPLNWGYRAVVIAFSALGMAFLLNRKKMTRRSTAIIVTVVIATIMMANSIAAYSYNRNAYEVEQNDVDEICTISDQLATRGSGGVVVVLDKGNTGPNNLIDTYLQDGAGDYRYVALRDLRDYLYPSGTDGAPVGGIDYVLANTNQDVDYITDDFEIIREGNAEDGEFGYDLYRRRKDPESATLIDSITARLGR